MEKSPVAQPVSSRRNFVFIIVTVMSVALIVFAITWRPVETNAPSAAGSDVPAQSEGNDFGPEFNPELSEDEVNEIITELDTFATRHPDDPLAVGPVDAPVALVVYSDFLCSYCGSWFRDTLPEIVDTFVETGQVRIEWRDLPALGEESVNAAIAARAAANQGKFWEFSSVLYDPDWQASAEADAYDWESFAQIAEGIGLDVNQFLNDLNDPTLAEAVNVSMLEASYIGFDGTPAFIVGGIPDMGAHPFEYFEALIENRLEAAVRKN